MTDDAWQGERLPDVLEPGVRVVFVGINPGKKSAQTGHHFAGPNNHFWRLLHESGLTPYQLRPEEDRSLPRWGIGLTNIVPRPSRGEADLTGDDFAAGARALRLKLAQVAPVLIVLLGKQVYRAYAGLPPGRALEWGWQLPPQLPPARDFLAPNPSSRSTIPFKHRLALFRSVRAAVDGQTAT